MTGPTIKVKSKPVNVAKLIKKMEKVASQPQKVLVGFPENIPYPDEEGTNLIMVAATHEFGSADGKIPERSFMRAGLNEKKAKLKSIWKNKLAKQVLEGEITPVKALGLIGQWGETVVKSKIRTLTSPANSERTIKEKGSSNPLIDTGHMIQSVRYEVDSK
tara:strand:+ start:81 stop:563 length:483 start_codon:yes stop_codon:yes gene_type:complete